MAATDGTQLNLGLAGDLVSDEDMTGLPRGVADVPQLGSGNANYKVERTKVAVGRYGHDDGDAEPDSPLWVGMRRERLVLETEMLARLDANAMSMQRRCYERVGLSDRRGRTAERGNVR
jgi:hypothetical protein